MRKILTGILFGILICFSAVTYADQLKFVQVTDDHLSVNGSDDRGRDISNSVQTVEDAVKSINNIKDLDFVMFSGDNINTAEQSNLIKFCEITKKLIKPYYIGIGNHDVFTGSLSKTQYFEIVKQYNKNQKTTDSEYYFFPDKNFIVIVMDGVIQMIPSNHGCYNDADLEWLDETLTKYANKKAIIVQHFPVIEPNENKSHKLRNPQPYLDLLTTHKNVIAVLSGHYHCAKVTLQDNIYHISSPALVQDPAQYRVVEINYDPKTLFQENAVIDLKTELVPVNGVLPAEQK